MIKSACRSGIKKDYTIMTMYKRNKAVRQNSRSKECIESGITSDLLLARMVIQFGFTGAICHGSNYIMQLLQYHAAVSCCSTAATNGFVLWSVWFWFKTVKPWSGSPGNVGLWRNTRILHSARIISSREGYYIRIIFDGVRPEVWKPYPYQRIFLPPKRLIWQLLWNFPKSGPISKRFFTSKTCV